MVAHCVFQKARRKDFECFHHKEMISVGGERYI
jgi:hypothetical protein